LNAVAAVNIKFIFVTDDGRIAGTVKLVGTLKKAPNKLVISKSPKLFTDVKYCLPVAELSPPNLPKRFPEIVIIY